MTSAHEIPSSWRDPSGIVFLMDGRVYRAVRRSYAPDYMLLTGTGLYGKLCSSGKLVSHQELDPFPPFEDDCYKVLMPAEVPIITYPYEWCFSQLKDAALLTLEIEREALNSGMSLKDANAYNIQFMNGRPVLIDTLSFERYAEGTAWVAYRQFCEHFLAPLCLIAFTHGLLQKTLLSFPDGIPLSVASAALPRSTLLRPGIFLHLHLHSRMADRAARQGPGTRQRILKKSSLLNIIDSLQSVIRRLRWERTDGHWQTYYSSCSYSPTASENKQDIVRRFLQEVRPRSLWDFGANTGEYSLLAAGMGTQTVAFESDPGCVEQIYRKIRSEAIPNLLPVLVDLMSPSPSIGWNNEERIRIFDRSHPDMIMALALIHHLAIGRNVPFRKLARLLASLAAHCAIEFVPKDDPQAIRLLEHRRDIFPQYTQEQFELIFTEYFEIQSRVSIADSHRCLYLMRRREVVR